MANQKYLRPGLDFAVGRAIEECGELCAALGKTIRWGWSSSNPELPKAERETNAEWVRREIADVRRALKNLEDEMKSDTVWPIMRPRNNLPPSRKEKE